MSIPDKCPECGAEQYICCHNPAGSIGFYRCDGYYGETPSKHFCPAALVKRAENLELERKFYKEAYGKERQKRIEAEGLIEHIAGDGCISCLMAANDQSRCTLLDEVDAAIPETGLRADCPLARFLQ